MKREIAYLMFKRIEYNVDKIAKTSTGDISNNLEYIHEYLDIMKTIVFEAIKP
jgi:hypothetical protein